MLKIFPASLRLATVSGHVTLLTAPPKFINEIVENYIAKVPVPTQHNFTASHTAEADCSAVFV
jgi:hypothetical protein